MTTNEIPARYARLTAPEAAQLLAVTREVLAENDTPAMREHAAHLEAVIALRGGREANLLRQDLADDRTEIGRRAGSTASNQFGTFEVHAASAAQVRFLTNLIAEKDTTGVKVPATLDGISKKSASALIEKLIDRPAKAGTTTGARPASDKQVAFVGRLFTERNWAGVVLGVEIDTNKAVPALTGPQASAVIETLLAAPRKVAQAAAPAADLESGIYRHEDAIYKVYRAVHGSGKMVAKLLVLPEGWSTLSQDERKAAAAQPTWEYRGLATRFVKAEDRMTLEQAKAFGAIYGVCCKCGATLTDEESINNGIGPVCAKKGW